MGIKFAIGDATRPRADGPVVIAHICNDVGGWGRGFVLALSKRWPDVEAAYRRWYSAKEPPFELGAVQLVEAEPSVWVANMIGQHGLGRGADGSPPIRYPALERCLTELADLAVARGASVHMPRIGCGLAGGTWEEIEPLVSGALVAAGVSVTVYDLGPD